MHTEDVEVEMFSFLPLRMTVMEPQSQNTQISLQLTFVFPDNFYLVSEGQAYLFDLVTFACTAEVIYYKKPQCKVKKQLTGSRTYCTHLIIQNTRVVNLLLSSYKTLLDGLLVV